MTDAGQNRLLLVKDFPAGFSGALVLPYREQVLASQKLLLLKNKHTNSVVKCSQFNIQEHISITEWSVQSLSPLQAVMDPLQLTLLLLHHSWPQFSCKDVNLGC